MRPPKVMSVVLRAPEHHQLVASFQEGIAGQLAAKGDTDTSIDTSYDCHCDYCYVYTYDTTNNDDTINIITTTNNHNNYYYYYYYYY